METVTVPGNKPVRLLKWMVKPGDWLNYGTSLIVYRCIEDPSTGLKSKETELKSKKVGRVKKLVMEVGQVAKPGVEILVLDSCTHPVVMKDMCAECGVDLRLLKGRVNKQAQVSMVPNIPELKISEQQATELGEQDKARLHKLNKLVLLVDLDQTLIHTTQNQSFAHMCKDEEDFFTFQLHKNEPTLYTKLRPYCREFLLAISKCYELQVVTFGSRMYAHKIAEFIDPNKKYFANRILSRDECINPLRKSGNLRHLFPCGDSMVCIIDDRDDVWSGVPNLIMVRKYSYFPGSGDINSPDKMEAKKETESRKDQVLPKEPATSCTTKQNATPPQTEAGDATNPRKRKSETDDNEKSAKIIKNSVDREPEENQNGNIGKSESVIMKDLEEEQKSENQNEEGNGRSNDQGDEIKKEKGDDEEKEENKKEENKKGESTKGESTKGENTKRENTKRENTKRENTKEENTKGESTKGENKKGKDDDLSSDSDSDSSDSTSSSSGSSDNNQKNEKRTGNCVEANGAESKEITTDGQNLQVENMDINNDSNLAKSKDENFTLDNGNIDSGKKTKDAQTQVLQDHDDYLKYLESILLSIHATYYDAYIKHLSGDFEHPPDLRGVVPFLRSKILYGCSIVLTGIIPSNFKSPHHMHKAHVTARQLGAAITPTVTDETTHLIGAKKGTAKYQDALKFGKKKIHMVSIDWLWTCSERWERVSEKLFPLPSKSTRHSRSRSGTPPVSKLPTSTNPPPSIEKRYNPVTGKLIKKVLDPRLEFTEAITKQRKINSPIYTSLKNPEKVLPVTLAPSSSAGEPSTSKAVSATRSRKPSMAEVMGIGYTLSSNDIEDMDKEVEDLMMSDEDDDTTDLGTKIDRPSSSSSEGTEAKSSSTQLNPVREETPESSSSKEDSSSSEEEFDHMAELLDHEMHYDEDSVDKNNLD